MLLAMPFQEIEKVKPTQRREKFGMYGKKTTLLCEIMREKFFANSVENNLLSLPWSRLEVWDEDWLLKHSWLRLRRKQSTHCLANE